MRFQDPNEAEEFINGRMEEMKKVYDFYVENGMDPETKVWGDIYNDYMEF